MTKNMYRKCLGNATSGLKRKRMYPFFLLLLLVIFILYTMKMVLSSGNGYSDLHGQHLRLQKEQYSDARSLKLHNNRDSSSPNKDTQLDFREAQKYLKVYNLTADYKADFRCVEMKTNPRTPICVYDAWSDMYISHDLIETGLWEKHVLLDFLDDLKRDESLGVLDIGANIGVYSLLAANLGRKVVAIEPFQNNIYRLHRSAVIAGTTTNIVVLQNAVGDVRDVATLKTSGNNQGNTRIVMGYQPCKGSCPKKIKTILLSDILYVMTFDRAIIKIDIQGYEHLAFRHIEQLLKYVTIPFIYMEWLVMKGHSNATVSGENNQMVKDMIHKLYTLDYRPYSLNREGATELDAGSWHNWPLDIVWRHLPSQKEYQRLLKNHFMAWP